MATNSISEVQCLGSANNMSARYSATRIGINRFPTQQAYTVIKTPYLCSARARFDPQLAHSLLTEIFRDFLSVRTVNSSIRSHPLTFEGVTSK